MGIGSKKVEFLVVDTTAFIQNAPLHEITEKPITCREVVDEITNKRQLRRLVTLPYDLEVRQVDPDNIKLVTDFSIKTGDYPSLSATDIKVIALTYQLEKEKVGIEHICTEPKVQRTVNIYTKSVTDEIKADVAGFFVPGKPGLKLEEAEQEKREDFEDYKNVDSDNEESEHNENGDDLDKDLVERFGVLQCSNNGDNDEIDEDKRNEILPNISDNIEDLNDDNNEESDDDSGWITPSNIKSAKKQINSELMEDKHVTVACMTTDFAMQNVLKQMNLNILALDGRLIKQLRTFILRCYTCFKTTSIMTKKFCPKCGNNTLKKVAVSLDENGRMQIHINGRKPLTSRGKKFSLPRIKGGKHPNNPILVADQPIPDNRPSRLARTKTNALDDDYIAGFSPFAMRDVTSRSAQLGIRPGSEMKYWMRKNPNEARKKRK